ncbi:MAG TPA: hypothetical protein VKU00_25500 [Chthonomonadaceae bacterium]|nr:hypothetical protein [Chthonomonadaceae bacterium]
MSVTTPGSRTSHVSFERERGVYALQIQRDVARAVISIGDDAQRSQRILQVFRVLAEADVPVFLIKMHRTAVTLAFADANQTKAVAALDAAGLKAETQSDLALVFVRAASMRDLHGVMVAIADALFAAGARLYETGDSHNSVQCLIEGSRTEEAVSQLCATFHLDAGTVQFGSVNGEAAP